MKRFFFAMMLMPVMALAETEVVDGITWTYTISDGEAQVACIGNSLHAIPISTTGAITIPSTLGKCPVTGIGSDSFLSCRGLTSVVIPSSVRSIGDYAFSDCSGLTSVTIPSSVTSIGNYAFSGCSELISLTIPSSVTSIGVNAFSDTHFYNNLPDGMVILGNGVLYTFKGECPQSVVIPSSVTSIGNSAFWGCSGLVSVMIPSSVKRIGTGAFRGCNGLESVTIPEGVSDIGYDAFVNCRELKSVTIPSSVTSIGGSAFSGCSRLTEVHISDLSAWCNVKLIGTDSNPLYYAKKLYLREAEITELQIPEGVTSIGSYVFYGCSGLTSVTIPSSVTSIGVHAFNGCSGLTEVHISDLSAWCNVKFSSAYSNPLYYAKKLYLREAEITELQIPEGVTSIGSYVFYGCSGLTSVTVPSSVTNIGVAAFRDCAKLISVTILNGVTSIGSSAFSGCRVLMAVTIPSSVKNIGGEAFYGCSGLISVMLPSAVTNIGWSAFRDCANLGFVTIPDGVTRIEGSVFSGCRGLTSVTIPSSVTSIGDSAFYGCSGMTCVEIPNNVTNIGSLAFSDCSKLDTVAILAEKVNIGEKAFYSCPMLADEDGFVIVNGCLYQYFGTATDITIPLSVTNIGEIAFVGCSDLRSVELLSGVERIGPGAFDIGTTLEKVVVQDLEEFANICFDDYWANPRNCADALYVRNELHDEMCTVLYSIGDYALYSCFYEYDEFGYKSFVGQTITCEVPVGCSVDFESLNAGIEEWGDYSFIGWESDTGCVISNTEVVAKWRLKTLSEMIEFYDQRMLYGSGIYAVGDPQFSFIDADSGCYRTQGRFCLGTNLSWSDSGCEYESCDWIIEQLTQHGQFYVVLIGYDKSYQEVSRIDCPVMKFDGQMIWSGTLPQTNCIYYVTYELAHSYYDGRCDFFMVSRWDESYDFSRGC